MGNGLAMGFVFYLWTSGDSWPVLPSPPAGFLSTTCSKTSSKRTRWACVFRQTYMDSAQLYVCVCVRVWYCFVYDRRGIGSGWLVVVGKCSSWGSRRMLVLAMVTWSWQSTVKSTHLLSWPQGWPRKWKTTTADQRSSREWWICIVYCCMCMWWWVMNPTTPTTEANKGRSS